MGEQKSLHAGAASKLLLAGMSDAEIAGWLARADLQRFTKTTLTSPAGLKREIAAIRKLVAGETVLDSQLNPEQALKGERSSALTPRELEILQMIVDGKSNKEIASALDLSANTIAVHRANMMETLGIHKAAELVVYAIRNGLVDLP